MKRPRSHFVKVVFCENDFLVSLQTSIPNESAGENCVEKFSRKVGEKCHQSCLVAMVFCTKLYRKLAVSKTMSFAPSQELILITDSWKASKPSTIAQQYLVSKTVRRGFLIFGLLPIFYCRFSKKKKKERKNARFCNMNC